MRSQRAYQQAFPTDRILEVLKRNDGAVRPASVPAFRAAGRHLPIGNLVRLDTGEVAASVDSRT
jgi:HD-GYP domain-containing protein (c-di-GMP phosphodiesterase class II)